MRTCANCDVYLQLYVVVVQMAGISIQFEYSQLVTLPKKKMKSF